MLMSHSVDFGYTVRYRLLMNLDEDVLTEDGFPTLIPEAQNDPELTAEYDAYLNEQRNDTDTDGYELI